MGTADLAAPAGHSVVGHAAAAGTYRVEPRGGGALLLWDCTMFGVVVLYWTLLLTRALVCFIIRVMKGPAYVVDAYPLPSERDEPSARC